MNGEPATPLVVDRKQDVAVLRVPALNAAPLALAEPHSGDAVAILGYPENGPFDARPGRIGSTADVLVRGSLREVTALSGLVRHGNSGGPAVNERAGRDDGLRRAHRRLRRLRRPGLADPQGSRARDAPGLDRKLLAETSSTSSTPSGRRNGATT